MILPNIDPRDAIALLKTKDDPASRHNLAVAYRTVNELDAAQEIAFDLWQKQGFRVPELALLISNLFLDCGNYVRTEEWAQNAWELQAPNETPEFALPLAMARMRLQRWDRLTWHLWEIGRAEKSWNLVPGTTRWRGERNSDPVVVLSEGGYGDAFLFRRFLEQMGSNDLVVFGPQFSGLKGFMPQDHWGGACPTIWHDDQMPDLTRYKYSTALMSFMATMDVKNPAEIPEAGIMSTPPSNIGIPLWDNTDHFNRPPSMAISRGPRLGICWRAEENGVQKRSRSIEREQELSILQRHGPFVNLCPGGEIEGRPAPDLIDVPLNSWTDTARVIAGLDCVVSVDTAVLHLAGMLGVPAIGILPLGSDWKWGTEGESNWWWPSVRLVRNTSPYTFRPALEKVAEMLERL